MKTDNVRIMKTKIIQHGQRRINHEIPAFAKVLLPAGTGNLLELFAGSVGMCVPPVAA